MVLDFCVACGSKTNLEQHHIVPLALSGLPRKESEKLADINDTITLCHKHHDMWHGINREKKDSWGNLISLGIRASKARKLAAGESWGRPRRADEPEIQQKIINLFVQGVGARETMRRLGVGTKLYYRTLRIDGTNQTKPEILKKQHETIQFKIDNNIPFNVNIRIKP
jgi:hypothetical protein